MTTPIIWDPVPVPSRQALTALPAPAANQAKVIDGNLAKVNDFLVHRSPGCMSVSCRQQSTFSGTINQGGWSTFNPALWPATTFVVPDCSGALIFAGGSLYNGVAGTALAIGANLTGAGYPTGFIAAHYSTAPRWEAGGGINWLPRDRFVIGAMCTLTPVTYVTATQLYAYDSCEIGVQFLT